jgi:hypothetical protein
VKMACGHWTEARLESGAPVCRACLGVDPGALVIESAYVDFPVARGR